MNERTEADQQELHVANVASDSTQMLFGLLVEKGRPSQARAIAADLIAHNVSIRAILDFDTDGILSFKFYLIRPDCDPKLIVDATPTRDMQG